MSEDASAKFHLSTETVVATLAELFRAQGNRVACDVLENAKARIEETGYDNWDGGTDLFTLFLDLPMKTFAHVESDVPKMEKLIAGKFVKVLPAGHNQWLQEVAIRPVLEDPAKTLAPKVAPVDVEHLWSGHPRAAGIRWFRNFAIASTASATAPRRSAGFLPPVKIEFAREKTTPCRASQNAGPQEIFMLGGERSS